MIENGTEHGARATTRQLQYGQRSRVDRANGSVVDPTSKNAAACEW
jgi:hypothetical protein